MLFVATIHPMDPQTQRPAIVKDVAPTDLTELLKAYRRGKI